MQEQYSYTQRIPHPQILACKCITDELCHGKLDLDHGSNIDCIQGYTVAFDGLYWAGIVPPVDNNHNTLASLSSPCDTVPSVTSYTNNSMEWASWTFIHVSNSTRRSASEAVAANPIDVAPYLGYITPGGGAEIMCFTGIEISSLIEFQEEGEFFYDLCVPGYCKADITESWIMTNVSYPCVDNREGILCGQCKPGYAVKPQSWVCVYTLNVSYCSSAATIYQ